jgi:hypothetical protein
MKEAEFKGSWRGSESIPDKCFDIRDALTDIKTIHSMAREITENHSEPKCKGKNLFFSFLKKMTISELGLILGLPRSVTRLPWVGIFIPGWVVKQLGKKFLSEEYSLFRIIR